MKILGDYIEIFVGHKYHIYGFSQSSKLLYLTLLIIL